MNSPDFSSNPTTSGSPPLLSISLSDHSFSVLASSFACTLAHSWALWRFMFFSKRAFNSSSSSSRCSGNNSFLFPIVIVYLPEDIVCRDRHSVVVEDGDEFCGGGAELDHHQAAELGVAVLFDDEDALVCVDEIAERAAKREGASTHGVKLGSFFCQQL